MPLDVVGALGSAEWLWVGVGPWPGAGLVAERLQPDVFAPRLPCCSPCRRCELVLRLGARQAPAVRAPARLCRRAAGPVAGIAIGPAPPRRTPFPSASGTGTARGLKRIATAPPSLPESRRGSGCARQRRPVSGFARSPLHGHGSAPAAPARRLPSSNTRPGCGSSR